MINWVPGETLELVEQMTIEQALNFYRGNKTQTAASLGIAIRTLDNKLNIYMENRKSLERTYERQQKDREFQLARAKGQAPANSLSSAEPWMRMEPDAEVGAESKMSMSERAEVQEVLPRQAPASGKNKGR